MKEKEKEKEKKVYTVGETNGGSSSSLASNPEANAVVDAVDGILVSAVIITGTQIVKETKRKAASNETFMFLFLFLRESADYICVNERQGGILEV